MPINISLNRWMLVYHLAHKTSINVDLPKRKPASVTFANGYNTLVILCQDYELIFFLCLEWFCKFLPCVQFVAENTELMEWVSYALK